MILPSMAQDSLNGRDTQQMPFQMTKLRGGFLEGFQRVQLYSTSRSNLQESQESGRARSIHAKQKEK